MLQHQINNSHPLVKQVLVKLQSHIHTPLYVNSYTLILNQIASAGLGLIYWLMAARLYPAEVVGQNAAIISLVSFIMSWSELSLKAAMQRFVPQAGLRTPRLILYTYAANLLTAVLLSTILLIAGSHLQFTRNIL